MANKNVNILLRLQDQFTRPMREAGTITRNQEKAMRKVSQSVIGFSRNVRQGFLGGAAHVLKFGAALTGVGGLLSAAGLKAWASDAIEGFNAAEEAETKLAAVLANVPSIIAQGTGAAEAAKERLVGLADGLEEVGVVAGDVNKARLQQLATFQLTEESLAKLTPGLADLIAQQKGVNATQEDAIGFANLLGKAMTGQTGALSRAGIIMTEHQKKVMQTGTEMERAAMMAEILEANVGGVNEALADTDAGKIAQTKNLLGRAQDEIGGKLMHLKGEIYGFAAQYIPDLQNAALGLIDKATPKIEGAMTWIADHTEDIKAGIGRVKDGVATAWGYIKPVLGFAVQHANTLIPLTLKLTAGIAGISIVSDVAGKVSGLARGLKDFGGAASGVANIVGAHLPKSMRASIAGFRAAIQVTKGTSGLTGVLKLLVTTGFGPVVLAIGAAIAAGVLLYKHWDEIKPHLIKLRDAFVTVFNRVRDVVTAAFDKIKSIAMPILDAIKAALEKIKSFIDTVKTGLGNLGFGGGSSWGDNPGSFQNLGGKATGTPYWRGGPTYVNEGRRGEIINLPSGTQIIPHDVSMAAAQSGGGGVTVNVFIQGNVIGNRAYAEELGQYVAQKILNAWEVTA